MLLPSAPESYLPRFFVKGQQAESVLTFLGAPERDVKYHPNISVHISFFVSASLMFFIPVTPNEEEGRIVIDREI